MNPLSMFAELQLLDHGYLNSMLFLRGGAEFDECLGKRAPSVMVMSEKKSAVLV